MIKQTKCQWILSAGLTIATTGPVFANDNHVAHRLFSQNRPAEAAELFSDQAWKGVAFFRSGQWWRAAEAFVRSNSPDSLYNLGNTYVRLGYHSLALEAYLATVAVDPEHKDALHNADVIRRYLAARQDQKGQRGLTPKAREIDQVEQEPDPEETGQQSESGDDTSDNRSDADDSRQEKNEKNEESSDGHTADSGGNNESSEQEQREQQNTDDPLRGKSVDQPAETEIAGGSESTNDDASDPAAGKRLELEKKQATEQWLNAIRDDPAQFLAHRISQEMRRREAAGNLPRPGPDQW